VSPTAATQGSGSTRAGRRAGTGGVRR
jgi:hypothetical protein